MYTVSRSKLEKALKVNPTGEYLAHSLKSIRNKAEPLLSKIVETFPDYTTHGMKHSDEVLKNFDFIIPGSLLKKLNPYEIYFLVAATYLHDIGMVNFPGLLKEESKEIGEGDKKLKDYIRESHHLRSEEFIVKNFKDLMIDDNHQANIIGRICKGHRKENLHDRELFKPDTMYKNYSINVPLLAAFLRLADELDITFERAPSIIYEHITPRDIISNEEWEKHLSIAGAGASSEDPLTIKCSSRCKNPKIHRILRGLEIKINKELEDLPNHLHRYGEIRKDLPRKFLIEIEAEGYKPYDFKFSLQEKEIVELLMGERLYKRKKESIRELLKNSVDTCRFKCELLKKHRLTYVPEILFELTPEKDRIIVTDNGIGMDEDTVERYFTKIGKSFYKSPEFLEEWPEFTSVSELGIGILSCFMIANKIIVETKSDDSDPLLIEIDDVSDYFFVRKGERKYSGTSVTLFLKDNIGREIDLEKEIRNYTRHLEFSVKVILPTGEERIIKNVDFEPNPRDFALLKDEYDFHLIKLDHDYFEGVIALILKKDTRIGLKPERLPWYNYKEKEREINFVSNNGIFVCNKNILPDYLRENAVFTDINLKRNALNLNIARNDIIQDDKKFEKFSKEMEEILTKSLENFLIELEQDCKKANLDYKKRCREFFEEFISNWTIEELWKKNKLSNKILNFIKNFYYFKTVSKDGINYIRYDEIVKNAKPIYFLALLDYYTEEHIKQILSSLDFTEDNVYLLDGWPFSPYASFLFENFIVTDFTSLLNKKISRELKGLIPKSWKLVKFENYKTSRLIEFSDLSTVLNRDNRFIDLLIKGKDILRGEAKLAVEGFFRSLKMHLKSDFQEVINKQKDILQFFVNQRLIKKNEIDKYLLTKGDFPPKLF